MDETWSLWSSLTNMHYMHWKLRRLGNFLTSVYELVATGKGKWSIGTDLNISASRMEKMGKVSGNPFLQDITSTASTHGFLKGFSVSQCRPFPEVWSIITFFHSIWHWHQGEIYEASLEKLRSWGWQWHSGNMFGIATNFRDSSI